MATTPTPANPSAQIKDFTACVAAGGKITIKNNGDGTFNETCILDHKTFAGPTKQVPHPNKEAVNKNPLPQKTKAEMELAQAALKLTNVSILSDGTRDGTKIQINGKAIANLASLSFRFYNDGYCGPVGLDYTVKDPNPQPGDLYAYTTYCYKPMSIPSAYAKDNKVVASEGGGFEVKNVPSDPFARSVSPGRTGYANAFSGNK